MTGKELMYAEDALAHEQFMQTKLQETAQQLQDQELKHCLEQMMQKGRQTYQSICSLL